MKRTFQVIRGGLYRDVQGIEEVKTVRSQAQAQKAFQKRFKEASEALGMTPTGRPPEPDRRLYASEWRL